MNKIDTIIIGGGITGLSVAMPLYKANKEFLILEKENRLGGQISTKHKNGFTYEVGPNTGTISHSEVVDLFEFADECKIETAKEDAKNRWVFKNGQFHSLPSGLISAIKTPLFTFKDKIRILGEPFRAKGNDKNESVGSLAERRLGKSFVEYGVDPFVGGIYAANPYNLTTRFALPKLYNLEQNYGSFIRGAIKKKKEPKTEKDKKATKEVFSAVGGFENLVSALVKKYNGRNSIKQNVKSISIQYNAANDFTLTYSIDDESYSVNCRNIVTAVPAFNLPEFLSFGNISSYMKELTDLVYAPMIEVLIGFNDLKEIKLNSFGGLVPSKEKRDILGILFPSSCFNNRTPNENDALFTVFMGGMRDSDRLYNLSDDEIKEKALDEVYTMLKIDRSKNKPSFVDINKHDKAIPQYDYTMENRLQVISRIENEYKGLHIGGNIRDGIGLSHRISQGVCLGEKLL